MISESIKIGKAEHRIKEAADIFAAHGDFLFNVFRKELNEPDARDLWQNFFLSLIKRPIPNTILNTRSYLYRAAINDVIDFKRHLHNKRKKMQEYSDIFMRQSGEKNPVRDIIGRETLMKALQKIKENLPPSIGQALLHKYSDNLSHREIAEKMNIKKSTVSKYLSVGTRMMEQIQDQDTGD